MIKYTNKKACSILGWDRQTQGDDKSTGTLKFAPGSDFNYFWSADHMAAALYYLEQRRSGLTVRVAGNSASRLFEGMLAHPDADQLTEIELENRSLSILPTPMLDLSTGQVSGGFVRVANMIDVRNLKNRLQRLIDADALVVGDRDD